jgi:hypothetical protein
MLPNILADFPNCYLFPVTRIWELFWLVYSPFHEDLLKNESELVPNLTMWYIQGKLV